MGGFDFSGFWTMFYSLLNSEHSKCPQVGWLLGLGLVGTLLPLLTLFV